MINIILLFFWLIGIIVFVALGIKIFTIEDNSPYIGAMAILISAFLASTSVMKAISESKKLEKNKTEKEKENLILHLEYILIFLLHHLDEFEQSFDSSIKRMSVENKNAHIKSLKEDYFFNMIINSRNNFVEIRKKLENQNLYKYIESGNRILLVQSCLIISQIETSLNILIESKNFEKKILELSHKKIKLLRENLKKIIKNQKIDLEKNGTFESLYTLEEIGV